MIQIQGRLTVVRRTGARGSFSVGDLTTPVGEFKVKDAILDQFEAGEYKGTFVIAKIFAACYAWKGRVIAEIRASLADIVIDAEVESPPEPKEAPPEDRDPIEEAPALSSSAAASTAASSSTSSQQAEPERQQEVSDNADANLFGSEIAEMVAARANVKLDPTVDREAFRKQRDRLKAIGYRFDPTAQAWGFNQQEAI